MTVRWVLIFISFLLLTGSRVGASWSFAYPDLVFDNIGNFTHVTHSPVETNATVASRAGVCAVLKARGGPHSMGRSAAQGDRHIKAFKILMAIRIFVLPVILLFLFVHTRSFIRETGRGVWQLPLLMAFIWFILSPLFSMFMPSFGFSHFFVVILMSILAVLFPDRLRVSPKVTWCVLLLVAFCFFVPLADWVVPKGYDYLSDYEFPDYSLVAASTNQIAVHEKLDLRPEHKKKAVLFVDGRRTKLTRETLEPLLQKQKIESIGSHYE